MRATRPVDPGDIWGVVGQALGWMEVTGAESGGVISVAGAGSDDSDADEEDREGRDVIQAALPGFGSVAESGDDLLTMRTDDGGATIAAKTARPADSQGGDRFISHKDGGLLREVHATGGTVLEAKGMKAAAGIILGSDQIVPGGDGVPGPHCVARDKDPVIIGGFIVGMLQSTSLHIKVG